MTMIPRFKNANYGSRRQRPSDWQRFTTAHCVKMCEITQMQPYIQ